MNTKDEIISALKGESMDMAPPAIFTQTGTESQMDACGCQWPDAIFDSDKVATLALQLSKQYGFANVRIPFDITAEAQTIGCTLDLGSKTSQPAVTGSPWISDDGCIPEVPDLISVDEFMQGDRIRTNLEAAEKIAKADPDLYRISSCVDALELAYYAIGTENALIGMMLDPDALTKWCNALMKYSNAYASALSEVSDAVVVIVEGSSDLIPPDMFDTFVKPVATDVVSAIKCFSVTHTCGDTDAVLESLASVGQDGISIDSIGDPATIMDRIGKNVKVIGGIDPIGTLLQGTPDSIADAAKKASDAGFSVIAPECGVPPLTSDDNMNALSHYRDKFNGTM